ncbi:unnamed protein product [Cyprideis torosa]|uniref:Protein-lysine N-methyltransferase SMYD4 n=1 Tax=Cyprideis torosa TaxID=163714 RepID=A0A7R8WFR4_9CRUS|nr:unnamed protein product [Cyprideis torosa]CAG0891243.1 unnamed protein product [Cyprideis torosa]
MLGLLEVALCASCFLRSDGNLTWRSQWYTELRHYKSLGFHIQFGEVKKLHKTFCTVPIIIMSMLSLEAPPQKYLNDENIFKTVCSKKIVQPEDKKGFFKDYVANIIKSLKKEEVEKFSQLKTDRDRILFLYDVPAAHEIRIGNFYFHKNSIDCEKKRKAGNDMFAKGKYPEAILMYNHCIMKAPPDNENYSLALANRSAALFHLRHFAHALVDIAEALKHNYPKNLRFKLQDRRGCCYMNFGHRVEAAECFNAALADLEESDLCEKRKKQWTRELKDKIVIALQVDGAEPKEPKEKHAIPAVSGVWPNTMFPNACEAFSVMFHPAFGRYACASKPIRTGDVLLVEAPYASYPIVEKSSVLQTCHHCLKRFLVPVPCPACAGVAFCGVRCREEALATYHQTECNIMNLLVGSGMSITCFLAFRILTQSGMAYFRAMKDQLIKGPDEEKFLNSEGVYDAESYLSVFNLVSHEDQRSTADLLHKTVMAMFLLKCLQSVKFFGPEISSKDRHPLTDDEVLAGSILVRNLQVLQFNAHEISEFYMRKKGDFRGAKSVFIGAGIYPTASFFNHSCDPGIVRYFCGDKIIIRAIRNLEPGDMIAENYGPVFTRMPLEERQLTLRTRQVLVRLSVPGVHRRLADVYSHEAGRAEDQMPALSLHPESGQH